MPIWITPSGSLGEISENEEFTYNLQCDTLGFNTIYTIIAGSLPPGLNLFGTGSILQFPLPTIYGISGYVNTETIYTFTIRALDLVNNLISDRSFQITVYGAEPIISGSSNNGNLGIFPDGAWTIANVIPLNLNTPPEYVNIFLLSGNLPDGLNLNNAGYITGYLLPENLYISDTLPQQSSNTKVFNFNIGYETENLSSALSYSMTAMRSDLYANPNANINIPVLHNPIILNTNHQYGNINLGTISSNSDFIYQIIAEDFENSNISFEMFNTGNVFPNIIPASISINANTGWITGFIDPNQWSPAPYNFFIKVFKTSEPSYSTTIPATLTITDPAMKNIQWNSATNIGNVTIGIPSQINVNAEILEPFSISNGQGAKATAYGQLIDIDIVNGGTNYSNGEVLLIPGGTALNNATITISNITANGEIVSVFINNGIQQYSKIPEILNNVIIPGEDSNTASFNLVFGLESINVINSGNSYSTVTIGFGSTGETIQAEAYAIVYNKSIANIILSNTGKNYQAIPQVLINGQSLITPTNPINYQFASGNFPNGLKLLSNGLIVGKPSAQIFENFQYINASPQNFNFTVNAIIGIPDIVNFSETDLPGYSSGNANFSIQQENQILLSIPKNFNLTVYPNANSGSQAPLSNLSLEFLLDNNDLENLLYPLNNTSIIPNSAIYRFGDFYFGIANRVRMLIAYGVYPTFANDIAITMQKYFYNKRFLLTDLRWAQSLDSNGNIEYEIIYIYPQDNYTFNDVSFSGDLLINNQNLQNLIYNGDQFDAQLLSPSVLHPATTLNMQHQINKYLSGFDSEFLPGWMSSIQPNGQILGFTPAIPLVYLTPGQGQRALFYLQKYYNENYPLNSILAVTDRLIWDSGFQLNWDVANNTWIINPLTTFDVESSGNITDITTETSIILITETGNDIITENSIFSNSSTTFDSNIGFYDNTTDYFLWQDDGSIYLKFPSWQI